MTQLNEGRAVIVLVDALLERCKGVDPGIAGTALLEACVKVAMQQSGMSYSNAYRSISKICLDIGTGEAD